ncbi:MAG: aminoacyl-tRNA hydrolase [Lachnospiraceae bacterium]|nr:aminoacyl-tRNA hydrolase [Lachnospiraceae bacterium]
MKIIVGLGNPGIEYVNTRHNVGFEVIDRLSEKLSISMNQEKLKGVYGSGMLDGEKVVLVKPMTYMNNSGECVGDIARFYKVQPVDVIVISDDINLSVGSLRIREKGSAGGHNGLKSIIFHLRSEDFPRVRVGVGMKRQGQNLASHVLGRISKNEEEAMAEVLDDAANAVICMVTDSTQTAMNKYNKKVQ